MGIPVCFQKENYILTQKTSAVQEFFHDNTIKTAKYF